MTRGIVHLHEISKGVMKILTKLTEEQQDQLENLKI